MNLNLQFKNETKKNTQKDFIQNGINVLHAVSKNKNKNFKMDDCVACRESLGKLFRLRTGAHNTQQR